MKLIQGFKQDLLWRKMNICRFFPNFRQCDQVFLVNFEMPCFLLYRIFNVFWTDSHQKIFDYVQILSLVTVIPSVFCIRTLLLFLQMLILCHPRVPLTTLLRQHYGNGVILGIKHMKKTFFIKFLLGYIFATKEHFWIQNLRMTRKKFNTNLHIKHQHIECS